MHGGDGGGGGSDSRASRVGLVVVMIVTCAILPFCSTRGVQNSDNSELPNLELSRYSTKSYVEMWNIEIIQDQITPYSHNLEHPTPKLLPFHWLPMGCAIIWVARGKKGSYQL